MQDRLSWDEVKKAAPPIEVSERIPPDEREELMELAGASLPVYAKLEKLWKDAPGYCPIEAPTCEPKWRAAVAAMAELDESFPAPLCGFRQGVAYLQRHAAHRAFIKARLAELRADLAGIATRGGHEEAWRALQPEPPPQPCLRCAPPPKRTLELGWDHPLAVHFGEGRNDPLDAKELALVKQTFTDPKALLVLRGHASKAENGDPMTLSFQRADAVKSWLVANGVPEARLKVEPFGDALPIAAATPDEISKNRRVDFEIEPR